MNAGYGAPYGAPYYDPSYGPPLPPPPRGYVIALLVCIAAAVVGNMVFGIESYIGKRLVILGFLGGIITIGLMVWNQRMTAAASFFGQANALLNTAKRV